MTSAEQAVAIDKYIADNHLPDWQPNSYEKAAKAVPVVIVRASQQATENPQRPAQGPQPAAQSPQQSSSSQDVFVWFDEPFPVTGAPLFEVLVTGRAYDGALAILRQGAAREHVGSGWHEHARHGLSPSNYELGFLEQKQS